MARKRTDWLQIGSGKSYAHRVHRPLQCLIFISPLLIFYQVASAIHPWTPEQGDTPLVEAFVLMLKFFGIFGVAGNYFPLLAVVAILLAWHLARKDKWTCEPSLYLGMAAESIAWGIPIFIIGLALMRYASPVLPSLAAAPVLANVGALPFKSQLVLSVGAGVYEELLFRLIAITVLNILLIDVFELQVSAAIPLIILASALLFSIYHYLGEPFQTGTFLFRTGIGVYLAGIYIYRGFGIAVGTHTVYDIIVATYWQTHHQAL
ncbi:MAG: CPBP family intramembrane metalloprotease [Phycisphaerales bacterium]|nr:CPBP family intramembrane metalloprotease [Phycisphaerales bacterium]